MPLKIRGEHIFEMWMGCGCGTNTRAEILALWGLLYFALQKGIFELHVYGDSKVLNDWVNDEVILQVAIL